MQKISKHLIHPLVLFFFVSSMMLFSTKATVAGEDVGLITQLQGKAEYCSQVDQRAQTPVKVFMKVRNGDHFKLAANSELQIIYRKNGRQETWRGPATLTAGNTESRPEGKSIGSPLVESLPLEVTSTIVSSPIIQPRSQVAAAGVYQLRGSTKSAKPPATHTEVQKDITEARQVYQELRRKKGPDDLTPELYLISVLANNKQYVEAENMINKLLAEHPDSPAVKEMKRRNDACLK